MSQDSHEFLCRLLEQVQREVLATAGSGPQVAISATACPASRNFGFCMEHQARTQSQSFLLQRLRLGFMYFHRSTHVYYSFLGLLCRKCRSCS